MSDCRRGTAALLAVMGMGSGVVMAEGGDTVIDSDFVRLPGDTLSGSDHTVIDQCGGGVEDWAAATASLEVQQSGGSSHVEIEVSNARPDTVYTVWLRMKGTGPDGSEIGWQQAKTDGSDCNGSPLTCGGATPLVNSASLGSVLGYSPPFAGTTNPSNGFTTDALGNGEFEVSLDFPVVGGAYPFHRTDADALVTWQDAGGNPDARTIPTAIVNPADGLGGPFLLRVVSHCQDGLAHGLSPSNREAWFDWPN